MQPTTQSQPEAPPAPAPPRPSAVTTVGADGQPVTLSIPVSQEAVDALVQQRRELSDQLSSVAERRLGLVSQLSSAPEGVARTGLEERVRVLDSRILQLENDLAVTGRLIASSPADMVTFATRDVGRSEGGDDFEEGLTLGVFLAVGFAVAILAFKRFRRRKQKPARKTELQSDSTQRLERLEQGMEAIAIEIERVSEGQRFVTKLLSEAAPVGVNARLAEPVGVEREKAATP